MPCNARPNRSSPHAVVGDPVQMAPPMMATIIHPWMATWRPKTSAIWPQNGIKAAAVRLNEATIQLSCDTRSKSAAIHGSALATTVTSSADTA